MIRLNTILHNPYHGGGNLQIVNDGGTLVFHGKANIATGCRVMVYDEGVIHFGANVLINSCCNFGCQKEIVIGNNAIFASGVCVYDTNFHYLYSFKTRSVKNICSPVRIGDDVWIGTRCYISKGTILPNGCTLGANTIISRPIEGDIQENSIIIGNPAKVVANGYTMIRGAWEWELMQRFRNITDKEIFIDYQG